MPRTPAPAVAPPAPAAAPAAAAVAEPANDRGRLVNQDDDGKYHDIDDDMDALAVRGDCTEDDLRAVKQARRLLSGGHMHMASRAAATDLRTLDCNDPTVLQQLRDLHPPASNTPMPAVTRHYSHAHTLKY